MAGEIVCPGQKLKVRTSLLVAIAMFQGIYKRVATKVGVHDSFASRVVNGKRKSPKVIAAMRHELAIIPEYINRTEGKSNGN
jgi:hypothetical protein